MTAETEPQTPQAVPAPHRRSLLSRLVRATLYLSLFLVLSLTAALGWVLGTESGLQWAYGMGQRLAPDLVRVERIEGRILDELRLAGVHLDTPEATVDVERLRLRWQPVDLLAGHISIRDLVVGGVSIATKETEAESEASSGPVRLPALVLPLGLDLGQIVVDGLTVTDPTDQPLFRMDRLELSAAWRGSQVQIHQLALKLPEPALDAELHGQVRLTSAYPLEADLQWRMVPVGEAALEGRGRLTGDLAALDVEHSLTGAADAELKGQVRDLLDKLSWEGELSVSRVDLPAFVADLPRAALTAELKVEGNLEAMRVQGRLTGESEDLPEYGQLQADLDLGSAGAMLGIHSLRLEELGSKARLTVSGEADLHEGLSGFDLAAQWERLRWPLAGDQPLVVSEQGELSIKGRLDAYRYKLQGQVKGADIPPTVLLAEGTGNLNGTEIDRLRLDALEGHADAKGGIGWAPHLAWQAEIEATDVNPGSQWAEWKGRLGGRVTSTGSLEGDRLKLEGAIDALGGVLRGYPVEAKGRVAMQGTEVEVEDLFLQSGPSRAHLQGHIGDRLALKVSLDSPDLRTLLPDLAGALSAEGTVRGHLKAPDVSLRLKAKEVVFRNNRVSKADASVDLGLGMDQPVRIDLDATGVEVAGLSWRTARIRGDGKIGAHQVSADLDGEPLAISAELRGGLSADDSYSGTLGTLTLGAADWGEWRLGKPAPFSASGGKVQAGPLCLQEAHQDSNGCVSFAQQASGQWRAKLDWERLALDRVKDFLPAGVDVDGSLSAQADFEASGGALKGNGRVQVPRGGVRLEIGEIVKELSFTGSELRVTANSGGLKADLNLPLQGLGGIEGALALDGWSLQDPARASQGVRGRIQAKVDDLGPLAALAPDLSNLKGHVDADVKINGTLQRPGIDGQARLEGGSVDIPVLGLELRDIALAAKSQGIGSVDYSGGLKSGSGTLKLSGQSRMEGKEGWVTQLRLKGERLTVANSSQYYALVSPDLSLKAAEYLLSLSGEVLIPEARIRPRSLPEGTVTPSVDVVLKKNLEGGAKSGPKIAADVRVRLGDEVSIEGFGLRGKLRGDLRVYEEPGKRPRGDGQLAIEDGTYRIQGIRGLASTGELSIEQGRVIYAKTPLDDPGILLLAQRAAGSVTAGLRVSGTLRNPKMTFFSDSDPGMSQAEVLNYLLTGGGSLGSGGGNASQVVDVGTYLTPKLYMQYEAGLADKTNKVKMRYDLTDSIQIQTESGDSQGADIFYTFER